MTRPDGRANDELREVKITRNWTHNGEGSVLIEFGQTRVLCTATFDSNVPRWLKGQGKGWVTAEYGMLPRSTNERMAREASRGKQGGRTHEIARLIGRSIRGVVDMTKLVSPKGEECQIQLDCDVLAADGGTRTASITGAYVALVDAINWAIANGQLKENPLTDSVSAISVGIIEGVPKLDLPYVEDSIADTDMNVVQTGSGKFIEVQGTAEHNPFDLAELQNLLALATKGNAELANLQKEALAA